MARGPHPCRVAAGQLRRQSMLGSTATYRVVEVEHQHVLLEVWDAPGLLLGETLRVTLPAVQDMELVGSGQAHGPAADAA